VTSETPGGSSSGSAGRRPIVLGPNQPAGRPYRGGAGIARFRGLAPRRSDGPEDFVASVTEIAAGGGVGLTVLDDGRTLRDHIDADPSAFLGPDADDSQPALLVKLLDTGERLFVHVHPDDDFAARHLGCRFGKTEAWFVLATEASDGEVYLGFARAVGRDEVRDWVDRQDAAAMLEAMNRVPVRAGDSILVPGGLPHAIGPGITLVELQQPTDFSILLEWAGYGVSRDDADLGLGMDEALLALDRSAWSPSRLESLRGLRAHHPPAPGRAPVFPPAAEPFFRADLLQIAGSVELPVEYSVIVVLDGEGTLVTPDSTLPLRRGTTLLLPYGAGPAVIEGNLRAIICRPPLSRPT
jgi:mannose-6-phosphate isomerase